MSFRGNIEKGASNAGGKIKSGEAAVNPFALEPIQFFTGKDLTKELSKMDPTTVGRASDKGIKGLTGQMSGLSQQFLNQRVPMYNPQQVNPQQVRAASVGRPLGMTALEGAVQTAGDNVGAAGRMDPRTMAFLQAAQQGGANTAQSLNLLRQAAMGQGPSAAQAQMSSGLDQAVKAQMAAAGSRGFNAAAMRGAQMQGAEMQQAAINQSAMLRAQEMQAAQQAFMQGSLSQEDMARNAALAAGQTTLQQDLGTKAAIQDAINSQLQGAGQYAGLGTDLEKTQAMLTQQARLANQDVDLRSGMFNSQLGFDAAALQQQGQLGMYDLASGLLSGQAGLFGQQYATEQGRLNQSADARKQMLGSGMQAGASILGAILSDKRSKTDIKPSKDTQEFLSALTDNQYRYKDPSKPGTAKGTQYGPMAQDLAKTKMGRTAVIDTPDGMMVDSARGFLLALSGLANINERLQRLETR
jgi:hypothetical protein